MNKIILSQEDIVFLDDWIQSFHRKYPMEPLPMPFKDIELLCLGDVNMSLKCYRNGNEITIYAYNNKDKLTKAVFEIRLDGLVKLKKWQHKNENDEKIIKFLQGAVCLYAETMFFMAFGGLAEYPITEEEKTLRSVMSHKKNKSPKKKKDGVVYLLHHNEKGSCIVPQGHHNSPSYAFEVRGHFRHYANGSTIWIEPYEKGGKQHKRGRTYKVRRQTPITKEVHNG